MLLAVVILLIFLHYTGLSRPLEGLAIRIFSPLQIQVYRAGAGINSLYSVMAGSADNRDWEEIEKQLQSLIVEKAALQTQVNEKEELLKQCNFLKPLNLAAVSARVIGKNPEANLQAIILDRGAADGIAAGMALISEAGIMVGKITRVNNHTSEAALTTDARSRIAALIQNSSQSKGIISGEHGLSLKMELIPQNEKVSAGDIIVTSGLEQNIPSGLAIGRVIRTEAEANSYFQTAYIQPLTKMDNLTVVSIIKSQPL